MTKSGSTRERILEHGLALMSEAGLGGVTLGVLADQVGMSKSGLFAHFKSKDEIQIALLEYSVKYGYAYIIEPTMREPEGLPRLKAMIRNWFGWAPRSGLPGGCPIAAGLFEYDDVDGPVRDKLTELEQEARAQLTGLTKRAVDLGDLRRDLDVDQFVWEVFGMYLAHHTTQRFRRSPDAGRRASLAFESLIERSMPTKRRRASASPSAKSVGRKAKQPSEGK